MTTNTTAKADVESLLPDPLLDVEVGDVIGVRSDWGAVVAGVVDDINRREGLSDGDWLLIIDTPIMWDVSDGVGRRVEVDKGPPTGCREDWGGMAVSLGVGTNRCGFPFAGEVILRQPEPVFDDAGRLVSYRPLPAGRVESVATEGVVDPEVLLKGDERPPARCSS